MPPETRVLPRPQLGPPPAPRVPRPARATLSNGLRVVFIPRDGIPQVAIRLVVPAGSVADPPGLPGTAGLTAALLTEGTRRHSAEELHERVDELGAALCAHAGHDFAHVEITLLAGTLTEGIPLFAEVVARPTFPLAEVERIRAESLDAIMSRADEPGNVADDRLLLEVFGAEHPYGLPAFGTAQGVETTPRAAMAALHAARYRPRSAFLIAAGEFDPRELELRLEDAFAGWTGEAEPLAGRSPPAHPTRSGEIVRIPLEASAQTEIRVAGTGLHRGSPDWIAASVANYVLGGSTILGRLGAKLREEKGWTYGARSALSAGVHAGGWSAETAVDNEVSEEARREILFEIARMSSERVPAEELQRARNALVLSLPRAFETPERVASRFSTLEAFGLPDDYWNRLPERVNAVADQEIVRVSRAYFDARRLVTVMVGGDPQG